MYILKNRVLSLFITIMLLSSGNILLFGDFVEPEKNVSQKNIQDENDAEVSENEVVKGDLFLSGTISSLGNLLGNPLGGLTKVESETIVTKEEMDPDTLVINVWATSRDHPREKEPCFNRWLMITAKKLAFSEKFPLEWKKLSNKEFVEKWDSLTEKEQHDLCPPMSKEELHKYWRQNSREALKSRRSDNWGLHRRTSSKFLPGNFPLALPIKYLKGRKEKDILSIEICDDTRQNCKNVDLMLCQKKYRYGNRRYDKETPFEDMFSVEISQYVRRKREKLEEKLVKLGIQDTEEAENERESFNKRLIELGVLDEEEVK